MRHLAILSILWFSNVAWAQKPLKIADFKNENTTEEGVMAEETDYITINVTESGELVIENQHQQRAIYFTDAGRLYADEYLYYSTFNTIDNIDAKIFDEKGKRSEAAQILTQDRQDGGIFYDDNKVKHIVYPHIAAPCQTYLSYRETIHDPHFLTKFFFSNYLRTVSRNITFEMPESVVCRFKIFNQVAGIKYKEEHKKNRVYYHWSYQKVPKYMLSEGGFSINYYEPHLMPFLVQYTHKETTKHITDSISDLYKWCYSHIAAIDTVHSSAEVCAFTDSLLQNITSPIDRMNTVYNWVQQNIKYVAIEDGYSGVVPRKPEEVLHRRYGDCKDMSALLYKCLQCAGIDAHISWIGTRDIPYTHREAPTSGSDNHMIVTAKIAEKQYFLDGTAVFLPSNLPSDFIQSKEALVAIDSNHFETMIVPIIDEKQSISTDSSYLQLQGETLSAKASFWATGYEKFGYAVRLIRSDDGKQRDIMKAALIKANNKCDISAITIKQFTPREAPLWVQYSYTVPGYARKVGNDIYVNLQLNKQQNTEEKIDTAKCTYGKLIDYKHIRHFVAALQLPEGYKVKNMPSTIEVKNEAFSFSATYRFDATKNTIYLDNIISINTIAIKTEQFRAWNAMIEQISKANSQVVVLTK